MAAGAGGRASGGVAAQENAEGPGQARSNLGALRTKGSTRSGTKRRAEGKAARPMRIAARIRGRMSRTTDSSGGPRRRDCGSMPEDTIAAVATPAGMGALAVVRVSGGKALAIAESAFRGKVALSEARDRSVVLGEIVGSDGQPIDQVLALVIRGPGSITGEDLVEISTHGGMLAPRLVLRRLAEAGARPAEPGEFTKRAFLNGKMDLAQAEAVEEIVRASSDKALRAAVRQLKGDLSRDLGRLEESLLEWLSLIEANIDFVEEEIDAVDREALGKAMDDAGDRLEAMLRANEAGRLVKDGLDVVIVGRPNVGKSSLFNRLLGKDRVIVSETAGTTRDVVDGLVGVDGVVIKIHDTAGVWGASDDVGREAVRRTREAIAEADLALVVIDASRGETPEDEAVLKEATGKATIIVGNKVDLAGRGGTSGGAAGEIACGKVSSGGLDRAASSPSENCIKVSALTGWGLAGLVDALADRARSRVSDLEYEVIANERHAVHLRSALESMRRSKDSLDQDLSLEFIASDIRQTIDSLGEITGSRVASRVLDEIFSRFCIGK